MNYASNARRWVGVVASVLLIGAVLHGCGPSASSSRFAQVRDAAALKAHLDAKDATVINALPEDSFKKNHIPGTISVPYDRVSEQSLGADKNAPLIFYCAGKGCPVSGMAADRAAKLGYRNLSIYDGGLDGWRAAGYTLTTGEN